MSSPSYADQIRIYRMPGPSVVHDQEVKRFQHELRAVISGVTAVRLAIDLSDTHHVSSRVLGLLVAFRNEIVEGKGRMVLFNVNPATQRVLTVTRLNSFLPVVESEREALEDLRQPV